MPDILEELQEKTASMSKGQRRVAEYILEFYDKAAFLTAGALGREVSVSESTVVRFASAVGYPGYPELQKALQEVILSRLTAKQRMQIEPQHPVDELNSVLQADLERLRATMDSADSEAFQQAVEMLLSARRVYVLGARSSAPVAAFLCYYLQWMLEDVRQLCSASVGAAAEQMARIGPQDLFLAISFPRYASVAAQAMKLAAQAGAATLALTDRLSSPIAAAADCTLFAQSGMVSLADSLVAPMSVCNALLAAVAARRKSGTAQHFEHLEEIWDTYEVYENHSE